MSAYTKGPWKWHGDMEDVYGLSLTSLWGESSVITLSDVYPGYAECGQDLRMEISMEDARLIAAAPDLLEALKEAVAYPMTGNWYEKAAAAIAKAEGRAE